MKISSQLLNIHEHASWQRAYGLTTSTLKSLLFSNIAWVSDLIDATGTYANIFSHNDPCEFFVGNELTSINGIQMLRALKSPLNDVQLFTQESHPQEISTLNESATNVSVTYCLMVSFKYKTDGIVGYLAFFGEDVSFDLDAIMPALKLLQRSIVDRLLAQKHKRLDQDRHEFHSLVDDHQHHAIFAKDEASKIVYANDLFLSLYPQQMQDKIIGYTTVEDYSEDQREVFLKDDREAFATGRKQVIETIDFPSGERKTLQTTKTKFTTRSGDHYILGISYDLTEQYALIDTLKRKNADLDEVANILATDLRAPANSMIKLISWLKEDLSTFDNEDVSDNLAQLQARATRISKLLSALYEYCFAGRDIQTSANLNLSTVVSDVLSDLKYSVEVEVDGSQLWVPATPFQRVLQVLIDNAVRHNLHKKPRISIESVCEHGMQTITVSDNGEGISPDKAEDIFRLFYSAKASLADEVHGLGLSIARKIVNSYDGSLRYDCNHKTGAKFIIKWPLAK